MAYADAARRIEQVKKMHEQQRSIVQHAELAASLVEKVPRSNILAELTNALPSGVSLLDFILDSKRHIDPTARRRRRSAHSFDAKKACARRSAARVRRRALSRSSTTYTCKFTGVADTDVQVAQYITPAQSLRRSSRTSTCVIAENFDPPDEKGQHRSDHAKFQIDTGHQPRGGGQ